MKSQLNDDDVRLIEAYARIAPGLLESTFGPNSCIHATRVTVEVLKDMGITARPLSVTTSVINAKYAEALQLLGRPFKNLDEAMKWHRETGAFSYGIGAKEAAGRWKGHLIAAVRQKAIVDLTIAQANHPEFDMLLEPILATASGRFFNGQESLQIPINGCRVIYDIIHGDNSFKETPAWNDPECLSLTRRICSELGNSL